MLNKENNVIRNMVSLLRAYKLIVLASVVLSLISAAGNIIIPQLSQKLIDTGLMSNNVGLVVKISLIIIFINLLVQVVLFFQGDINLKIQNSVRKDMSFEAFRHICNLKMKYFEEKSSYELLTSASIAIEHISQITNDSFLSILVQMIRLLGGFIGITLLSVKLTLIVIIGIIIRFFFLKGFKNIRDESFKILLTENKEFSAWYSDILNGIKIIKLWNVDKEEEFIKKTNKQIKNSVRFEKTYLFENGISEILEVLVTYSIYILAAILMCKGELTIGELFGFIMYSSMVVQPIFGLIQLSSNVSQIKLAIDAYVDFMDLEEEAYCIGEASDIREVENITFENVTWNHKEKEVISNISFCINKNEKIAIIGANGAGKSTLIELLLRLREPIKGEIRINDININNIKLDDYRKLFSVFCQEGYIFNDSVKINMLCNDIENKITKLDNTEISLFPNLVDGWDTMTGQNGSLLSGGERQKINLFRCIFKGGRILILDEATASYDMESEKMFNQYISHVESYDIIIVITHKPEILKILDKIILIDKGKVITIGTYEELKGNILFQNYIKEKE